MNKKRTLAHPEIDGPHNYQELERVENVSIQGLLKVNTIYHNLYTALAYNMAWFIVTARRYRTGSSPTSR